jgi:hypothetical protein
VREAAGEMSVDTGPGRGCRVTVIFPLGQAKYPSEQTNRIDGNDARAARSASL